MISLTEYTGMLTAVAALVGVVYLGFLLNRLIVMMKETRERQSYIAEREFHASYEKPRLEIEQRLNELNRALVRSEEQFARVNHLLLSGQGVESSSSVDNKKKFEVTYDTKNFLDTVRIDRKKIQVDKNLVFVLTPFQPSERGVFSAIASTLEGQGLRVIRGDEEAISGDILSHIVENILKARLIIANIDGRNPNVMYELGIAHALGKEVIIVASSDETFPFDLQSRRILIYKNETDLKEKLSREIISKAFS
ncbi:hypothetical protein [Ruegeria arenilitoris]|uniref:hypothetical protein n=1 Tax=Ruegeria arenilitoris TaxID=1173585 RepID=UPI003C7A89E8